MSAIFAEFIGRVFSYNFFPQNKKILVLGFNPIFFETILKTSPEKIVLFEPQEALKQLATRWLKDFSFIEIISQNLQQHLENFGPYDVIFIHALKENSIPKALSKEEIIQAKDLLNKVQDLKKSIHNEIGDLSAIRYTDEDLENFFAEFIDHDSKNLAQFILQLESNGQITKQQKVKFLSRVQMELQYSFHFSWDLDSCLDCLENHLKEKGCFLGVVNQKEDFYENPDFLEKILTNSNYDFEERFCENDLIEHFQSHQITVPKFFKIQKI